ncbi:MAG TPA: acyl-CoA desaturase [Polyangiaceae bacterium]|nr:acyl-CoA desaturase [Polyangiaceae bacterium]
MSWIIALFVTHWLSSVFCQTFFLHRYGAHRQFNLSRGWERFFHLLTYLTQGSSYLNPRGYAILHRMHHAYSDTARDPHSPFYFSNVLTMMWATKHKYDDFAYRRVEPEARFEGGTPDWPALDKLGQSWPMRLAWVAAYTGFYVAFAPSAVWFLLLPAHFVMGPIHGAIVNWGGHKYGYRNFESTDKSKNTLVFDFLTFGELFQNNHHEFAMSPNFAVRKFEVDPAYPIIVMLAKLGIVRNLSPQRGRFPRAQASASAVPAMSQAPTAAALGHELPAE